MYKFEPIHCLKQAVKVDLLLVVCDLLKPVVLSNTENGKIILWWRENNNM